MKISYIKTRKKSEYTKLGPLPGLLADNVSCKEITSCTDEIIKQKLIFNDRIEDAINHLRRLQDRTEKKIKEKNVEDLVLDHEDFDDFMQVTVNIKKIFFTEKTQEVLIRKNKKNKLDESLLEGYNDIKNCGQITASDIPIFHLQEHSERINMFDGLKISLKPHQLAAIKRMLEIENQVPLASPLRYYSELTRKIHGVDLIYTKYGLLGDKPGFGKTITTLAFCQFTQGQTIVPFEKGLNVLDANRRGIIGLQLDESYEKECSRNYGYTNLIIIKRQTEFQWRDELQKVSLKYYIVDTNLPQIPDDINFADYNIVLIQDVDMFKIEKNPRLRNFNWLRVFIDEAHAVDFSDIKLIPIARMYWLVTASYEKMFDQSTSEKITKNITGSSSIFTDLTRAGYYAKHILVKSTERFLDQSWKMPPRIVHMVKATPPNFMEFLGEFLNENVKEKIEQGDIHSAILELGGDISSGSNIIDTLCGNYKALIDDRTETIKFLELQINLINAQEEEARLNGMPIDFTRKKRLNTYNEKLLKTQKELQDFTIIYQRIQSKLDEIADGDCPICSEPLNDYSMVPCCNSIICFSCMGGLIVRKEVCPFCRRNIKMEDIKNYTKDVNKLNEAKEKTSRGKPKMPKTKINWLIDELTSQQNIKENKKYALFCNDEKQIAIITEALNNLKIKYERTEGTSDHFQKVFTEMRNNTADYNIILMFALSEGFGLNMEFISDLILYNQLDDYTEKQVIGRGERLGRTTSLTVHKLYNLVEKEIKALHKGEIIEFETLTIHSNSNSEDKPNTANSSSSSSSEASSSGSSSGSIKGKEEQQDDEELEPVKRKRKIKSVTVIPTVPQITPPVPNTQSIGLLTDIDPASAELIKKIMNGEED